MLRMTGRSSARSSMMLGHVFTCFLCFHRSKANGSIMEFLDFSNNQIEQLEAGVK